MCLKWNFKSKNCISNIYPITPSLKKTATTTFKRNFQHGEVTESGLCLIYPCLRKTLSKETRTLPYFSTSYQILLFLESSQSNHVAVKTHKPHPQMSDTIEHMKYTSAGVWVHPPTAAFWVLYTQFARDMQNLILRNLGYFTLNTISLSIQYLRLFH